MPQELLQLLDGHSFIDCHRCKRPSELVRVNPVDAKVLPECSESFFYAVDLQAIKRCIESYE